MKPIVRIALDVVHGIAHTLEIHASRIPRQKSSKHRFITDVNRLLFRKIEQKVHRSFPEHTVSFGSSNSPKHAGEATWIVEPICGAENYLRNINQYCTSIGIFEESILQHAIIIDHVHDDDYWVSRESGYDAESNRGRLRANEAISLEDATVGVTDIAAPTLSLLENRKALIRRSGCFLLDVANLARGSFDLVIANRISTVNHAIASLFVSKSAGLVGDWNGHETQYTNGEFLAGSPGIFRETVLTLQARNAH